MAKKTSRKRATKQDVDESVAMLLSGGIFRPPGVDVEPAIDIYDWAVYETVIGDDDSVTRHVIGTWDGLGRVSSKIIKFDAKRHVAITNSGREYNLDPEHGGHGIKPNALYVWDQWARLHRAGKPNDVTKEYL